MMNDKPTSFNSDANKRTEAFSGRFDCDLMNWLRTEAFMHNRSVNNLVETILLGEKKRCDEVANKHSGV